MPVCIHQCVHALILMMIILLCLLLIYQELGNFFEEMRAMTRKAKALGMTRTIFKNASGLPNRAQLSTARDMSRLGVAIRRDFPQYFKYFKRTSFNWQGRKFRNHNKLLTQFSGTDGIKTGYTSASGFNLVATVQRGGVRLIGVVFGGRTGRTRDKHMVNLLTRQFKKIKPVIGSESSFGNKNELLQGLEKKREQKR